LEPSLPSDELRLDGVGYLFGGVVAGKVVANLSVSSGWKGVFKMLAVVANLVSSSER
jgi:hypothetical protein